ncbi:MAG: hypothetical protein O3A13_11940 [Proteobacteria bacterium]|nr:hypothetical protein [Pseudomonadota bacterium]
MKHLALEVNDGIALVTFGNPPLSVMTPQTVHELHEMLPALESSEVRAILIATREKTRYFPYLPIT